MILRGTFVASVPVLTKLVLTISFVLSTRAAASDWRAVNVGEAFPGSLADLNTAAATNGGVSGTGTSNKGNFSINSNDQMAISFVEGTGSSGDLVIGRSKDGKTWERYRINEVDMRNSWFMAGNNIQVALTFVYTGPGPQVQIDDAGNVCLAYLAGNVLATAVWPAGGAEMRHADRIVADVPVERCGLTKFDRQIAWFQLCQHGGHFYLITTPDSAFADFVRVYELDNRNWREMGKPIQAKGGSVAWDEVTGDMYLGVQAYGHNVNGTFPAVFRWNSATKAWQELRTPASGLRETFGITSYPGGGCPTLFAREGDVWAFWWQDGNMLQAAQLHAGRWISCARTTMHEWDQQAGDREVEHQSFGSGQGIYHTGVNWVPQCVGLSVCRDNDSGDLVVFACDGAIGLLIHQGHAQQIKFRAQLEPETNKGFDVAIHTSPMMPHTAQTFFARGSLYRFCTLKNQATQASDVFVYRLSPSRG